MTDLEQHSAPATPRIAKPQNTSFLKESEKFLFDVESVGYQVLRVDENP